MSRCFPFPPPGYEKKHRPEEDLLKEEKHSAKKHKKEKKDNEKREGKDKKERDKSDRKHKEKKDRKEKHREKKEKHRDKKEDKDRDRSKDKERSSISEDAIVAGQPETSSVEKVGTGEERLKSKSRSSDKKQFALHPDEGQNGHYHIDNRLFSGENEESKFVQELDRRIRDEGKAMGSHLIERFSGADYKGHRETVRVPVGGAQKLAEVGERNRERRVDNKALDGQGLRIGAQPGENTVAQHLAAVTEHTVEGITGPAPKDIERSNEGKYNSKDRGDDKRGEKRKDKDKGKKNHEKDKGREKEKKKEEKMERTGNKKNDQGKSKELYKNEVSGFSENSSSHLSADGNKNLATVEILKKRKDVETNGFLHENEDRPNKLPRPTSLQLTQNGRIFEASRTPSLHASHKQGVASNSRVDNKEGANGTKEVPLFFVSKQKAFSPATRSDQPVGVLSKPPQPSQTGPVEASRELPLADQVTEGSKKHYQANQTAESSRKPPHPDVKYLSQVLLIPKVDEWSGVDDQDWLFSSKDPPLKKPELGSSGENKEAVVWAEAVRIESTDIYALPYVIPY